ncbi:hypothetical protein NPIL_414421, partial [Nephila pilipes]
QSRFSFTLQQLSALGWFGAAAHEKEKKDSCNRFDGQIPPEYREYETALYWVSISKAREEEKLPYYCMKSSVDLS